MILLLLPLPLPIPIPIPILILIPIQIQIQIQIQIPANTNTNTNTNTTTATTVTIISVIFPIIIRQLIAVRCTFNLFSSTLNVTSRSNQILLFIVANIYGCKSIMNHLNDGKFLAKIMKQTLFFKDLLPYLAFNLRRQTKY